MKNDKEAQINPSGQSIDLLFSKDHVTRSQGGFLFDGPPPDSFVGIHDELSSLIVEETDKSALYFTLLSYQARQDLLK